MSEELEREFEWASFALDVPDTPDIAWAVIKRIERERIRPRWARPAHVAAAAFAALVLLASAILVFSPTARKAVADLLGIPGIGIRLEEPRISPLEDVRRVEELGLGEAVSLEEAQARVEFTIGVPSRLGLPDKVLYRDDPVGGMATLVYPAGDELPANDLFDAGVLLTQFMGDFQTHVFEKFAGSGTTVQQVSVNGVRAFWIGDAKHGLTLRDRNGDVFEELSRPALSVIIWDRNRITYRLEADIAMAHAIRIAESVE